MSTDGDVFSGHSSDDRPDSPDAPRGKTQAAAPDTRNPPAPSEQQQDPSNVPLTAAEDGAAQQDEETAPASKADEPLPQPAETPSSTTEPSPTTTNDTTTTSAVSPGPTSEPKAPNAKATDKQAKQADAPQRRKASSPLPSATATEPRAAPSTTPSSNMFGTKDPLVTSRLAVAPKPTERMTAEKRARLEAIRRDRANANPANRIADTADTRFAKPPRNDKGATVWVNGRLRQVNSNPTQGALNFRPDPKPNTSRSKTSSTTATANSTNSTVSAPATPPSGTNTDASTTSTSNATLATGNDAPAAPTEPPASVTQAGAQQPQNTNQPQPQPHPQPQPQLQPQTGTQAVDQVQQAAATTVKVGYCLVNGCTFGRDVGRSPKALLEHLEIDHLQGVRPSLLTMAQIEQMGLLECRSCHRVLPPNSRHPNPCTEVVVEEHLKQTYQYLHQQMKAHKGLSLRWDSLGFLKDQRLSELLGKPIATFDIRTKAARVLDPLRQITLAAVKDASDKSLDPVRRSCAFKALYLLPGWLFNTAFEQKPGLTLTEVLARRLRSLLDGDITGLEAERQRALNKDGEKKPQSTAEGRPAKAIRRAKKLIADGEVGKALACLAAPTSILDPKDPKTPWVATQLKKKLLCSNELQASVSTAGPPPLISRERLVTVLKGLPKSSPGPSGWRYSHLKTVFAEGPGPELLARHLTDLLTDPTVIEEFGDALRTGTLTVLDKGKQDVRPIGCMESTVRVLSKYAVAVEQRTLAQPLLPEQLGVGVQGGGETAIHVARLTLDHYKEKWVAVMIDMSNAYGSMKRSEIAKVIEAMPYESSTLLRHVFNRFAAPKTTYVTPSGAKFEATLGVVQGEPSAPLMFSATLDPVLKGTTKMLMDEGMVFAYLDDVAIIGEPVKVAAALKHFTEEAAKLGLKVNELKTKWLGDPSQNLAVQERIVGAGFAKPGTLFPAVKFLGAPVGINAEAERNMLLNLINEVPSDVLRSYPDLQGRMLMLRIGMNAKFSFIMRTNRCMPDIRGKIDKLLHEQVLDILDIQFENSEWGRQIHEDSTLPLQLGGLGLTHAETAAPLAYAISAIQAYQRAPTLVSPKIWDVLSGEIRAGKYRSGSLLNSALAEVKKMLEDAKAVLTKRDDIAAILSNKQEEQPTNSPLMAAPVFPESIGEALNWQVPEKAQRRLQEWCAKARLRKTYERATSSDKKDKKSLRARARILARCQPGAYAWLQAIPTNWQFILKNNEFRVALRLRMGLPIMEYLKVAPNTPCPCSYSKSMSKDTFLDDDHWLNCSKCNGPTERHNDGCAVLMRAFAAADVATKPEQRVTKPPNKDCKERYDISATLGGVTTHFDVTMPNALADHYVEKAAVRGLAAAEGAAKKKNDQYISKTAAGELFIPLPIEVFGGMHRNVFALLGRLSLPLLNRAPEDANYTAMTFIAYWTQALSVTTVRGSAQMALTLADQAMSRQLGRGHSSQPL